MPLYVDASRFIARDPLERSNDTAWPFALAGITFPGTVLGEDSPWLRNSPRRPMPIRRPGRHSHALRVYRQPSLKYHDNVNQVTPGTTLFGYFQAWRYFEGIADRLAEALTSAAVTDAERQSLAALAEEDTITAHVRRGDYLTTHARGTTALPARTTSRGRSPSFVVSKVLH